MVDLATTYALLIGIEQYQDNTKNIIPLDGPANDVWRFAKWLRDHEVPAENISVLLSPLEGNKEIAKNAEELLGKQSLMATRQNVTDAFEQFKNKTNVSLFLMLWSGHGFVESGDRRLLYSDATMNSLKNLDLNKQLKAMRSTQYRGIRKQIIIVDACANSLPDNKLELLGDPMHTIDEWTSELDQLVLYAANLGQKAKNDNIKKAGVFFDKIFEKLDSLPTETWPPDMKAIMQDVQQEFNKLRDEGQSQQTPAYALYIADGNEESFVQGKPKSEVDGVQTSSAVLRHFQDLTPAEAEELRTRFLACPSISDSATRRSIVQQLRYGIANEFNKGGDARDVMDLIKICLSYPHGVDELLYLMNFYERNSDEIKALRENVARILQEKIPEQIEGKYRFKNLLFEQKNSLVRELLKCDSLKNSSSRTRIIEALIPPIPNRVEREGKPREVVFSILEECDKRDGGFLSFLKALEEEEENSSEFRQAEKAIKDLFA